MIQNQLLEKIQQVQTEQTGHFNYLEGTVFNLIETSIKNNYFQTETIISLLVQLPQECILHHTTLLAGSTCIQDDTFKLFKYSFHLYQFSKNEKNLSFSQFISKPSNIEQHKNVNSTMSQVFQLQHLFIFGFNNKLWQKFDLNLQTNNISQKQQVCSYSYTHCQKITSLLLIIKKLDNKFFEYFCQFSELLNNLLEVSLTNSFHDHIDTVSKFNQLYYQQLNYQLQNQNFVTEQQQYIIQQAFKQLVDKTLEILRNYKNTVIKDDIADLLLYNLVILRHVLYLRINCQQHYQVDDFIGFIKGFIKLNIGTKLYHNFYLLQLYADSYCLQLINMQLINIQQKYLLIQKILEQQSNEHNQQLQLLVSYEQKSNVYYHQINYFKQLNTQFNIQIQQIHLNYYCNICSFQQVIYCSSHIDKFVNSFTLPQFLQYFQSLCLLQQCWNQNDNQQTLVEQNNDYSTNMVLFYIQLFQQVMRNYDQSIYQYLFQNINQDISNQFNKYLQLQLNIQITQKQQQKQIYFEYIKALQLLIQSNTYLKRSKQVLSNFKLLEYSVLKMNEKINSNQFINKQIRQIIMYVTDYQYKNHFDNNQEFLNINDLVVQQINYLPLNKYLINFLPSYYQFKYISLFIDNIEYEQIKCNEITYAKHLKNHYYILISHNSMKLVLQINDQLIIEIPQLLTDYDKNNIQNNVLIINKLKKEFDHLLKCTQEIHNQIKQQANNQQINQFHQILIQTDQQLQLFAEFKLLLVFSCYFGLITQQKLNIDKIQTIQKLRSVNLLEFLINRLGLEQKQNNQLTEIQQQDQMINQLILIVSGAVATFLFQINNKKIQMITDLNKLLNIKLFHSFNNYQELLQLLQQQNVSDHQIQQQYSEDLDETIVNLIDIVIQLADESQYNGDNEECYLHIDPSIQRFPFEVAFKNSCRFLYSDQTDMDTRNQNIFFIDNQLKQTNIAINQQFLSSHENWKQVDIKQLQNVNFQNYKTFFYGGHGGGENYLQKMNNSPNLLLMGCSSLCEILVSDQLRYQFKQRFSNCKYIIGCLWDVLSQDLDQMSLEILKEIQQNDIIQNIVKSIETGKQQCKYRGLVGCAVVLYGCSWG